MSQSQIQSQIPPLEWYARQIYLAFFNAVKVVKLSDAKVAVILDGEVYDVDPDGRRKSPEEIEREFNEVVFADLPYAVKVVSSPVASMIILYRR